MTQQRFASKQAREILALAADSERAEVAAGEEEGFTLADLRQAATEAGINPSLVDAAAREIAVREHSEALPDARDELRLLRLFPEQPSRIAWERIVRELRSRLAEDGVTTDFGTAQEWSTTTKVAARPPFRLRIESDRTGARATFRQSLGPYRRVPNIVGAGLGLFGVIYAGMGPLIGQTQAGLITSLGFLTAALVGSVGGRRVFERWRDLQEDRLTALADRISLLVREENERAAKAEEDLAGTEIATDRSERTP